MLSLQTKEIVRPSMNPRKVLQTYKRKHSSIHPDGLRVENDNLSSESPNTIESERDDESTKQATETCTTSVELSQNLGESSEDLIKSQSPCRISCGQEEMSFKINVDRSRRKKAPLLTFIRRRTKRKIDASENNSNFEMQEGDNLPADVKEAEKCQEESTQKSSRCSDEDKRIEESSLHCTERSESAPLASVSSILAGSALAVKERVNCSSCDSVKDLLSEVHIHEDKQIEPSEINASVGPETPVVMVNGDQQVTIGSISDEALNTQISVANLILLCEACDTIMEDSTRQNKSQLASVEVNAKPVSNGRDIFHQMSTGFPLPDLNVQPDNEDCLKTHEENENPSSCGNHLAEETTRSTPESTLSQPETRVFLSSASVSNYKSQNIDQAHDFLQPWRAYEVNNPPLFGHTQMLNNILTSSRIFNRQKVSCLTTPQSQPTVWSEEELDSLWIGVRRHGAGNWAHMLMDQKLNFFDQKTPEDLAKRWDGEQSAFLGPTLTLSTGSPEVNGLPNFFSKYGNGLSSGDFHFKKRQSRSQSQLEDLTTAYPSVTNDGLVLGLSMYSGNRGHSPLTKPDTVHHWLKGAVSTSDLSVELTLTSGTEVDPKVNAGSQRELKFFDLSQRLLEPMGSDGLMAIDGEDSSEETISDNQGSRH